MDYPDPNDELDPPASTEAPEELPQSRRSGRGGGRRGGGAGEAGERKQLMIRRGIALGAGVLVLILLVIGTKGCLDARKNRSLEDYSSNVTQIVDETNALSGSFFGLLEDPGELSVTEFTSEVESDRGAMDGFLSRVEKLSTPGDMESAQQTLVLAYQLRASSMEAIAARMPTALGDEGREAAIKQISGQIGVLAAADVLFNQTTRHSVDNTILNFGASAPAVPRSTFVPDAVFWGDPANLDDALGAISGGTQPAADGGVHGTGLSTVSIGGVTLDSEVSTVIPAGTEPAVEVGVTNQGESDESDITVSVSVDGGSGLEQTILSLAVGETGTASILLTPAPTGEITLEIKVAPVSGELVLDNNEATYTVSFE
ncbi:MAG: CARDB domain-containing protein [Solirubrobacterales bacterium]